MIKGFRQIASLTALSRVFGLGRDIAYTYFFGASGLLDAWFIAFKIPNLSRRLFGEGAASASFIPVYSNELHQDPKNAARLANTVVTMVFTVLAVLMLMAWAAVAIYTRYVETPAETRLMLTLASMMLPYMVMSCTVAILAGVLNVHRHFAAPAAAPIIMNIFIIVTVVTTGLALGMEPRQQLFATAVAVVLAGAVQLLVQLVPLSGKGVRIRPAFGLRNPAFMQVLVMMGPMILGLTVTQINTLADDLIAWWFSSSPAKGEFFMFLGAEIAYPMHRGSVSYLNVAQRLYQMPLKIFGVALATAIFPVLSAEAARGDYRALTKTVNRGIKGAIFIALPAMAGLILIRRPLVSAAFERGQFTAQATAGTAWTLMFYSVGLSGYFIQQIAARAFYSLHDSKTPARSAMIAVCVNVVLNLTLIWPLATGGLALSTAVCSYLQVVILLAMLKKRLGTNLADGVAWATAKTLAATAIMTAGAGAVLLVMRQMPVSSRYDLLRVGAVVPAAVGIYFVVAKVLNLEMLTLITGKQSTEGIISDD